MSLIQIQNTNCPFVKMPNEIVGVIGSFLTLQETKAVVVAAKAFQSDQVGMLLGNDNAVGQMVKNAKGKISAIPEHHQKHLYTVAFSICQLAIRGAEFSNDDIAKLSTTFKNLTELDISELTDQHLSYLLKLRLKKLKLTSNESITPSGFKTLSTHLSIEELDLSWTKINGQGLTSLKALKSLRKLELSFCHSIAQEDFEKLNGYKNLLELDLMGTLINNEGLKRLYLPQLTNLNISYVDTISSLGFLHLKTFESLKELDLGSTKSNDETLEGLIKTKNLKELSLLYCKFVSIVTVRKIQKTSQIHITYNL